MAQLSRARDRSMHSIVATIQAEQDQAIRAPGKGVVSISGGPGTGKTVVALHRAAYLLYTDRRRYEGGGVLVVGPSGVFMRYIERVLPSLGETAVALRSLGEVVDGVRASRHDEPAVADVKGSARMAELMRRAARQQAPGSPEEFRVFWRDDVIVLDRAHARPRAPPADGAGPPQPAAAARRHRAARRHVAPGARRARTRAGSRGVRRRDAVGPALVRRLRGRLVAAARRPGRAGVAARPRVPGPCRRGRRRPPRSSVLLTKSWSDDGPVLRNLSVEDVPLLDELRYALGDVPARHRGRPPRSTSSSGADLQELTTAADREYAPSGRAWAAAHATGSRTTASRTCSSTRPRT